MYVLSPSAPESLVQIFHKSLYVICLEEVASEGKSSGSLGDDLPHNGGDVRILGPSGEYHRNGTVGSHFLEILAVEGLDYVGSDFRSNAGTGCDEVGFVVLRLVGVQDLCYDGDSQPVIVLADTCKLQLCVLVARSAQDEHEEGGISIQF